jgi:hypothetical protein
MDGPLRTSNRSSLLYVSAALGALVFSAGLLLFFGGLVTSLSDFKSWVSLASAFIGVIGAVSVTIIELIKRLKETEVRQAKIEKAEESLRENPDKPQLAWDLARTKLENYLDKNLGQLQSIFWLTASVMIVGFGIVLYGLTKAYESPAALPVSIVGAASGVIISFIGASFLIIYRSILTQTRRYVSVLERINAVGMAVQVLGTISLESKELRNQSIAKLASQLINLYSTSYQIDEAEDRSLTREEPPRKRSRKAGDVSGKKD